MGVQIFSKLGLPQFWRPITLCVDLWLRSSLKKSCSPHWEISNGMWHTTCMQGNQGNSWLLMIGSQIANLTPNPFFGHNLCFKYSNGSCEPILDIYVPSIFQWYNELFNPMVFDPCSHSMKIWKSIIELQSQQTLNYITCVPNWKMNEIFKLPTKHDMLQNII